MAAHSFALQAAQAHAQTGRFQEMLEDCRLILSSYGDNIDALLDAGVLLFNFGFFSQARECFERAETAAPGDLRPQVNLANLARDAGEHALSREMYSSLVERLPDNPVIRRNAAVSLEYDPDASDNDRLNQAKAWGEWAIARAGGFRPRPAFRSSGGRPLRIGYVSADFCQHTVGLFVKDVLKAHDPDRVEVIAYSAGLVQDWVTDAIRAVSRFHQVAALDDAALAALIRQHEIDVLIDLSGHTAGSRLTVFAHRPAPVMVSWLGYFATTGLQYIDAVLLDEWHAPPNTEAQFVEPIVRLPGGRFCYQPVPWAPTEVAKPPCLQNGYITFGCFNNTAKLNAGVFDVWAKILGCVPDSRLLMKWRTFNDESFRRSVRDEFAKRGVDAECIELRGPSFHAELLKEYADIDIALDPFPFTGGLTSCEAMWMGVPVVTWPQSRVVSRQSHALLSVLGLAEFSAKHAEDYVEIAARLANNPERLLELRSSMRATMQAASLMDVTGFTRQLENALNSIYLHISSQDLPMSSKTILHVGPGHRDNGAKPPIVFQAPEWRELRLDIDPANEPDIVGSMLDMAAVADASVDAIYSAHNIEHVYAHEVAVVLKEFLRVLKPDGYAVITCPDLQAVCALVAEDRLTDPAYQSAAGPITPLDIIYGHGAALVAGHHYKANKCGFTLKTLTMALQAAGFQVIAGKRRARGLDLWVVASKGRIDEAALRTLAEQVLPQ